MERMKATVSLRMAMPSRQGGELVLVDVVAVVGGAEVGLSFVEAAEGVAEELNEFLSALLASVDSEESLIGTTRRSSRE